MKYHKKRKSCKFGIMFFLMAVVLMCVLAINYTVPVPRASEHQLGIAVDINADLILQIPEMRYITGLPKMGTNMDL